MSDFAQTSPVTASELSLAEWLKNLVINRDQQMVVYQAKGTRTQSDLAYAVAKHFQLPAQPVSKDGMRIFRQESRMLVLYDTLKGFWYSDFARLFNSDYTPELPAEKEAIQLATTFLKENRLLHEGMICDGAVVSMQEQVEGEKRDKRSTRPNHVCVDFRLSFKEINSFGPGAKVKVFVGHKGEIIGLYHAVPEFQEFKRVPAVSSAELGRSLQQKLRLPLENVRVGTAKLLYQVDSAAVDSRFIQPVYVFSLATITQGVRRPVPTVVPFTVTLPATKFAPVVSVANLPETTLEIKQGQTLSLECALQGGTPPFKFHWESSADGPLGEEAALKTNRLSVVYRERKLASHTVKVTVTDSLGLKDSYELLVKVSPEKPEQLPEPPKQEQPVGAGDPTVGVEWCNLYHGAPGLGDVSGTELSARGFKNYLKSLPGWSASFEWGNDVAWEQDFKFATAPGGGTDYNWADNVDFAYFCGHGSLGSFYFGSTVDDHQQTAQDSHWGDKRLKWIVLHSCQTMQANFAWTVWCDSFKGLHQMFGFHTTTFVSDILGGRFAYYMANFPLTMQQAWRLACQDSFDSSVQYAYIYAGQSGTDTFHDHLPGYGYVSPDPTHPNAWAYSRGSC
ncbi:MAG TPA: DUF6345 domain-containing protein [Chloroflexia bacterium]|nr:DUF6345 domain-containing protein [Chloroflexia bacterium]